MAPVVGSVVQGSQIVVTSGVHTADQSGLEEAHQSLVMRSCWSGHHPSAVECRCWTGDLLAGKQQHWAGDHFPFCVDWQSNHAETSPGYSWDGNSPLDKELSCVMWCHLRGALKRSGHLTCCGLHSPLVAEALPGCHYHLQRREI